MYEVGDFEKPGVVEMDTERTDMVSCLLASFFSISDITSDSNVSMSLPTMTFPRCGNEAG